MKQGRKTLLGVVDDGLVILQLDGGDDGSDNVLLVEEQKLVGFDLVEHEGEQVDNLVLDGRVHVFLLHGLRLLHVVRSLPRHLEVLLAVQVI